MNGSADWLTSLFDQLVEDEPDVSQSATDRLRDRVGSDLQARALTQSQLQSLAAALVADLAMDPEETVE